MDSDAPRSWREVKENGVGSLRVAVFVWCLRIFGRRVSRMVVLLVFVFAYPFLTTPRKISADFLARVSAQTHKKYSTFGHLLSFAYALLDKVAGWIGKIRLKDLEIKTPDDWQAIGRSLSAGKGVFLISSHLGNVELLRAAFLSLPPESRVEATVIMSLAMTANFNKVLYGINPMAGTHIVSIDTMSPGVAMQIEERIKNGELIAMAGDRAAIGIGNNTAIPFMGEPAMFPDGAFRLASALECPVYALFILESAEKRGRIDLYVFPLKVAEGTSTRAAAKVRQQEFVALLERLTLENPYQWFNFFDLWQRPESS
ncbi:MAG: hypothetical protein LUC17_02810 [Oscillospiraceae bacterium]|nr:hypothetical protein [Oscillospiraceae bacterium]